MNCREFIDFLLHYFSGEMPCEIRAQFHEHIGECPDCVAYLRCYEVTLKFARVACRDCEEAIPARSEERRVG